LALGKNHRSVPWFRALATQPNFRFASRTDERYPTSISLFLIYKILEAVSSGFGGPQVCFNVGRNRISSNCPIVCLPFLAIRSVEKILQVAKLVGASSEANHFGEPGKMTLTLKDA
jgi:hypothetical protein